MAKKLGKGLQALLNNKGKIGKAAPKKKAAALIEGKYKRKFLLRLLPDQASKLDKIQDVLDEKTSAGTIYTMIENYISMRDQLAKQRAEIEKLEDSRRDMKDTLYRFKSAWTDLLKVKTD